MRGHHPFSIISRARTLAIVAAVALVSAVSAGGTAQAQGRGADAVRLEDRFNALERQNAALTGQVEQLQYRVQQLQQQIERMQTDYEFRLNQLEGGKAGGQRPAAQQTPRPQITPNSPGVAAPAPPPPPPPQPRTMDPPAMGGGTAPAGGGALQPPQGGGQMSAAVPSAPGSADQLYEVGFNQMQERNYAAAEGSFRSFLQAYPRHQLAGNAQFWIGEIYFLRKDYVNASIAYAEGYRSYRNSPKSAENLLQLGRSLALTNQVREACTTWDRLAREYPNAGDLIKMRANQERQRYRCA